MSCDGTSLCFVAARLLGELQLQCLFKAEHVEQTCDHISAAIGARPRQTCIPRRARAKRRAPHPTPRQTQSPPEPTHAGRFELPAVNLKRHRTPHPPLEVRNPQTQRWHDKRAHDKCPALRLLRLARARDTRAHRVELARAPSATLSVNNRAVLDLIRATTARLLTERVGFEPTSRINPLLVFETRSFNHSDTSPDVSPFPVN